MHYEVQPRRGINGANFGESRKELRQRFGEPTTFRRTPSGGLVDHYIESGLQFNFDESDRLEFIEFTPEADVRYSGIQLLGRPYNQVVADLRACGATGAEDDQGIEFRELGFALFIPSLDQAEENVEGVSVFSDTYYS